MIFLTQRNGVLAVNRKGFKKWLRGGVLVDRSDFYYRSGHKPNTAALLSILNGNVDELWDAFVWRCTPQGHAFWEDIYYHKEEFTKEAREYCLWLMEKQHE